MARKVEDNQEFATNDDTSPFYPGQPYHPGSGVDLMPISANDVGIGRTVVLKLKMGNMDFLAEIKENSNGAYVGTISGIEATPSRNSETEKPYILRIGDKITFNACNIFKVY